MKKYVSEHSKRLWKNPMQQMYRRFSSTIRKTQPISGGMDMIELRLISSLKMDSSQANQSQHQPMNLICFNTIPFQRKCDCEQLKPQIHWLNLIMFPCIKRNDSREKCISQSSTPLVMSYIRFIFRSNLKYWKVTGSNSYKWQNF